MMSNGQLTLHVCFFVALNLYVHLFTFNFTFSFKPLREIYDQKYMSSSRIAGPCTHSPCLSLYTHRTTGPTTEARRAFLAVWSERSPRSLRSGQTVQAAQTRLAGQTTEARLTGPAGKDRPTVVSLVALPAVLTL